MNILIVFALKQESKGVPEALGFKALYTGVGKVNAAIELSKALNEASNGAYSATNYDAVLNLGTAGSQTLNKGDIIWANQFIQHDMDVRPLGFKKGETPFEDNPPLVLSATLPKPMGLKLNEGLVLTGDSFVTEKLDWAAEAIDMEAYAMAKTCLKHNVPFGSIKYISDGANSEATNDWPEQVKIASSKFKEILEQHFI